MKAAVPVTPKDPPAPLPKAPAPVLPEKPDILQQSPVDKEKAPVSNRLGRSVSALAEVVS